MSRPTDKLRNSAFAAIKRGDVEEAERMWAELHEFRRERIDAGWETQLEDVALERINRALGRESLPLPAGGR